MTCLDCNAEIKGFEPCAHCGGTWRVCRDGKTIISLAWVRELYEVEPYNPPQSENRNARDIRKGAYGV